MMQILPASVVIPTRHRAQVLARTLDSLLVQNALPTELIVVDASVDDDTRRIVTEFGVKVNKCCRVLWLGAETCGAAAQRNQGVAVAAQPVIWFMDDDIIFEPDCVSRLWAALQSAPEIGGVNAMITNQCYQAPGRVSRFMFRLMAGEDCASYAGRILGPAVNLLPEDRDDLSEVVPVEWLNTTCTMYRREALPEPPFPTHFTGYSLMEDVTLSLLVARSWKLANVRTARIFHDSQPGTHKADAVALSEMELVNRHYVMTRVLVRCRWLDYLRLGLWECFQLAACVAGGAKRAAFLAEVRGKWRALCHLCVQTKDTIL
ncbi:glycosyltransferase [Prosthecobacter sp.]|uniref:glycosyltransferase family 2 protein n=1 Tax=Prosthecobacter sp. TaxID=1965333 RepID=UPI001D58E218|nr:glycosyltransferase [Prosthecobacter sp.]MCB1276978.1 glycosyltransferase family 2 protein [Prosthecobacter sp.]